MAFEEDPGIQRFLVLYARVKPKLPTSENLRPKYIPHQILQWEVLMLFLFQVSIKQKHSLFYLCLRSCSGGSPFQTVTEPSAKVCPAFHVGNTGVASTSSHRWALHSLLCTSLLPLRLVGNRPRRCLILPLNTRVGGTRVRPQGKAMSSRWFRSASLD